MSFFTDPQGFLSDLQELYTQLKDVAEQVSENALLVQSDASQSVDRYGQYNLQLDDNDSTRTYGGSIRSTIASSTVASSSGTPTVATPTFVNRLQTDLQTLGYSLVSVTGEFDKQTEWAIREFQIYSQMEFIAVEDVSLPAATPYVERLQQVMNPGAFRYTGDITGVANEETRLNISRWLTRNLRCPVIVQAREGGPDYNDIFPNGENIWLKEDVASGEPRMFVKDFTDFYSLPANRDALDLTINAHHYIVLGYYQSGTHGGPNMSIANRHTTGHSWTSALITPEKLWRLPAGTAMTVSQMSTYHTLFQTFREECYGTFDIVNAWDDSTISIPLCHWTMGSAGTGELVGLLSYIRNRDPLFFSEAINFFGIRSSADWPITQTQGVYRSHIAHLRLGHLESYEHVPTTHLDYGYFRTWHWFYRFVMLGRTNIRWRELIFEMARIRVENILNATWAASATPPRPSNLSNGNRPSLGDIYTSEMAMAMIIRWHVKSPGYIVSGTGEVVGVEIRDAYSAACSIHPTLDWHASPDTWTNAYEDALVAGLLARIPNARRNARNMTSAFNDINNYVYNGGTHLSTARGSFDFEPV